MVNASPKLESHILRVEASYRIRLPQPLLHRVGWIAGNRAVDAWLLLGSADRCRLFSASEVDTDPELKMLQARIAAELETAGANSLEFRDEVSLMLALRFLPVKITPPEPGWRLTLPRTIAAIMQLRPKESEVAALFFQNHIELWTVGLMRSAMNTPIVDIV